MGSGSSRAAAVRAEGETKEKDAIYRRRQEATAVYADVAGKLSKVTDGLDDDDPAVAKIQERLLVLQKDLVLERMAHMERGKFEKQAASV